jgi:hypothetical protein
MILREKSLDFFSFYYSRRIPADKIKPPHYSAPPENGDNVPSAGKCLKTLNQKVLDGPDVIRTHDLPVISRAHHRAMLRAQKIALIYPNNYSTRVFIGCESPGSMGIIFR